MSNDTTPRENGIDVQAENERREARFIRNGVVYSECDACGLVVEDAPAARVRHERACDGEETETCPNGEAWCAEADEDALPCFACYTDERAEAREGGA